MKQTKAGVLLLGLMTFIVYFSCSDSNSSKMSEYDPNKPVELTRFFPDSGGISTKVIIEGANFGFDTARIQVYFNEKKAAVVNAQGDKMYVLTPRLPGDTCEITVKIGDQNVAFPDSFRYKTQLMVSTIAGARDAGTKFTGGSLATATFGNIYGLAVDDEGNIFLSMKGDPDGVARVNVEENTVDWVAGSIPGGDHLQSPMVDPNTQIVYFPSDRSDFFYELNPVNLWIPRIRQIGHPSPEDIQSGKKKDFEINYKHSFAYCPYDGYAYTRSTNGKFIKFNLTTREGELVKEDLVKEGEAYLAFDPLEPHMMYITYDKRHCIYTFNLKTMEQNVYAGIPGNPGWRDGKLADAEFNTPRQICFDQSGILYIADRTNHCIRQINRDGIVSSIAGTPTKWGQFDGPPDEAGFDNPRAIAVDKDGNIFIGEDENNRMLRKLTLE
ncbi:IPT/TIG domain-containing protein [Prevotella sp. 10(H)]|uniref:IPT/TIG domain-containing protein n=1 Tax=Prevotella sp. 10(H) TaxID=1158294 RepID=UPI0004A6ABEC|nr:IPT/TIG domain-containing protein [Prevotella sp. 10(H)]